MWLWKFAKDTFSEIGSCLFHSDLPAIQLAPCPVASAGLGRLGDPAKRSIAGDTFTLGLVFIITPKYGELTASPLRVRKAFPFFGVRMAYLMKFKYTIFNCHLEKHTHNTSEGI